MDVNEILCVEDITFLVISKKLLYKIFFLSYALNHKLENHGKGVVIYLFTHYIIKTMKKRFILQLKFNLNNILKLLNYLKIYFSYPLKSQTTGKSWKSCGYLFIYLLPDINI